MHARSVSLSKDWILEQADQTELMEHYLNRKITGEPVTNPFRSDNHPGCTFWYSQDGRLFFTDWALGKRWDVFDVVMLKYDVSFHSAVKIITDDILNGLGGTSSLLKHKLNKPASKLLQVLVKP